MSGMNLMSERLFALSGDRRSLPDASDTGRRPAKRFAASDGRLTLGGTALLGIAAGFIEIGVEASRFPSRDLSAISWIVREGFRCVALRGSSFAFDGSNALISSLTLDDRLCSVGGGLFSRDRDSRSVSNSTVFVGLRETYKMRIIKKN